MDYYFSKTVELDFDKARDKAIALLKEEGFGVITEIDVKATMKTKLDADFRRYDILGACHPDFAHKALLAEDKIGVLLPCNVIVQEMDGGTEVAAMNPAVAMAAVQNPALADIAGSVTAALQRVVNNI
jgi:uncharacterized protein (DUF302 family)